jgi:hypothetical protein
MTRKIWKPTKSKTTAVIVAVLFGVFSWAYTYKYDAWKFWLNILLVVLTMGLWSIIAIVWVIVDQATKPIEFYEQYYDN